MRRLLALPALATLFLGGVWLATAPEARAHAFLAQTEPAPGARLAVAPSELTFRFSEPVEIESARVTLEEASGTYIEVDRAAAADSGRTMRVPLAALDDAVYVASWHVVSAVDGHETAGELAFAVGDIDDELPAASSSSTPTNWAGVLAALVFFAGTAAASGALAGQVLDLPGLSTRARRTLVRAGLSVALAAVGVRAAAVGASDAAGQNLTLAAFFLAVALVLVGLTHRRPLAVLLAVAGAWWAWAAASHAAAEGAGGLAADVVHLAAGALWTGALAQLAIALWRTRTDGWDAVRAAALRYAHLALVLVLALATAGTVAALHLVPRLDDLWSTGYGILVTVKAALLLGAVILAALARVRGLRHGSQQTRHLVTVEASLLGVALVLAAVLTQLAPPQPASAAELLLAPPPIEGPVARDARLAGSLTVTAAAGDGRIDLGVLSPSGGIDRSSVTIEARMPGNRSGELRPRPCGPGCFTQRLTLPAGRTTLKVDARAEGWAGGRTELHLDWPPPEPRPELFDRMIETMRSVPTVHVAETVSSHGPAPQPAPGGTTMSGQDFVALMPWAGGGVVDVHPHPDDESTFGFYLPGSRMLFEVTLDEHGHLIRQHAVNPGHEIRHRFDYPEHDDSPG